MCASNGPSNSRSATSAIIMDSRLLTLLQLCDSNFPSGAFSHSFGLETYIAEERVRDMDTFAQWLRAYLVRQLAYTDGLACRLVFEALQEERLDRVWAMDRLLAVQNFPREARDGSRRMGERMVRLGCDVFAVPLAKVYLERIAARESFGHSAVAFPIIARAWGISLDAALPAYLYACIGSLVQNGVRAIPLGQTDGQRLLAQLHGAIAQAARTCKQLDLEDFGAVSPGLEIAQMRHERLHVRLFMS